MKKEILPFATAWMDLKDIMICEISQRKIPYDLFHKWTPLKKKAKFIYSENKLVGVGGSVR